MSQGGYIPYHLRTNKAIERQIFVDTLKKIHTYRSIFEYIYVGFGGPFLEDFKLLHNAFDFRNMISLEVDENVVERQNFNKPYSCITCKHADSRSFVDEYHSTIGKYGSIVWLDYTRPKAFKQQLNETVDLIGKMKDYDIFRVTFNANPASLLENQNGMHPETLKKERLRVLQNRIGHYFLESQLDPEMMTHKNFPGAINIVVRNAIEQSVQSGHVFLPLTVFAYADGQQMYTLTGIVLPIEKRSEFIETTGLEKGWSFYNDGWTDPIVIDVPPLSVQEKQAIDAHLPLDDIDDKILEDIIRTLGFKFDAKNEMLASYVKYYRQFPQFSKMAI